MGNTGVAGRDDDVLFFNPAQLQVARGTSASVERFSANSAGGSLSSVTRLTSSSIAIGMQYVEYAPRLFSSAGGAAMFSPFPATRESSLENGDGAGSSVEATIGYARAWKSVRFGAAAKYVEDEVPGLRVGRAAFDFGLWRVRIIPKSLKVRFSPSTGFLVTKPKMKQVLASEMPKIESLTKRH